MIVTDEMAMDQGSSDSSSGNIDVEGATDGGWIQWFCGLDGNEFLAEIDEQFIRDQTNLFGLKHRFEPGKFK